ncbi:hypothetical protein P0Y35_10435 [Kiritimatiellaeota bacterium B1221]|nr:hypothetical protein [Kiritimatiellaeota bacterium B1221]
MKKYTPSTKYLTALLAMALLPVFAWSQAYVVNTAGTRVDVENIRVRPGTGGDLVVTIGGQSKDITKEQYLRAVGVKPAEIDQAQVLINQGKNDEAVKLLEGVFRTSQYMSWDASAAQKLAELQLTAGNPLQAKRTVDSLEERYGDNLLTFFPFLEKVLWDVKVVSNDSEGLEDELTAIIMDQKSAPDRISSALIVRGDLKASRKDYKAAVLDYLRANYFFGKNPDVQAEALYKTASMFAKIGDTGRLKKYSTLLKENYPDSEFSTREIGG